MNIETTTTSTNKQQQYTIEMEAQTTAQTTAKPKTTGLFQTQAQPQQQQQQTSLYKPVFIEQRVILLPNEVHVASSDMDTYLLNKIKRDIEGQCCTHGYVKPNSTQILSRSMGVAENGKFTGDYLFICKLRILCLLPYADQLVMAKVLKVNKMGALALLMDGGQVQESMKIQVPRDLHLGNNEFDTLQEDQQISVRLRRSQFQVNDPFIIAIAVLDAPTQAPAPAQTPTQEVA
jgi:DNA-directed RNA polymerase subunit E'/Rpb7